MWEAHCPDGTFHRYETGDCFMQSLSAEMLACAENCQNMAL